MSQRADLVIEDDVVLNAGNSYTYTSEWVDSGDIDKIRSCSPFTLAVQESIDQTNILNTATLTNDVDYNISARYFRVTFVGASFEDGYHVRASVRAIP